MFLIYDTTGEPTDIKTPTSAVLDEVLTSFARHLFKPLTYAFLLEMSSTRLCCCSKQGRTQDFRNTEVVILRPPSNVLLPQEM